MNECELVKKILNHMNAEDYKILINKVWFRGFWVPGIANQWSDKKWRPKVEFINNDVVLNRKIRKGGKHNYELLIEAMIKMAEDRNDETYLLYNVVKWITDPDSHEEIEEYFNQLENQPKDDTKNDSEEIKETSKNKNASIQDDLLKKENEKLKAEIDNWKNRGKKYKENIQNLKIKCSNLEQENNRVKKENGRLIRENEKTKQGKDTAVKEYNDRIIALSVENSKLKEKIRGKYKPKKNIVLSKTSGVSDPKVLCVTKNPADVLIKGYNIYFLTDLEELNKKIYTNKPVKFNEDEYFKGVPVFSAATDEIVREWELESQWSLYRNYNTLDEFCDCIKAKQPLGSTYGYDATESQPSFVIWKNQNQKLYVIGKIANCRYNSQRGLILEKEGQELLKIDISDQAEKIVYDVDANPTLAFVPETIYKQIEDQILKAEVERTKKLEAKKKEPVTKQNQEKAESFTETVNDAQEELKEVNTKEYSDELLIQMMDYHSQKRNLFYNMKDFVNVHTAIKCSNLVILSGLSGTGKSALVEIYARALGIRNNLEDDRLLFVPVRPSWNDDADLLGYVDLVHNVYRPSDTGFVDFLVNAQKEENKGKLFIVCFDEMNLARVEHYFSQFLSLLERPENQRELQLYDSQYAGQLYNSATYPSKIIIGDNIRFIGTVNIDESTYHFSDKVLDRANVIELDVLDYSKEWTKKQYASLITPTWSKDEYDALINKDVDIKADKVQELLWEIHQLLQSASAKYGVGPRIVKAIKMYINNLPKTEINGFNKGVALDYQIAQRILTKVRGPEIQIGRLLNGKSNTGFNQIFDKYSELSDFKKCRKVISEKQKELGAYGYCI